MGGNERSGFAEGTAVYLRAEPAYQPRVFKLFDGIEDGVSVGIQFFSYAYKRLAVNWERLLQDFE
jgi:hypothetical protein